MISLGLFNSREIAAGIWIIAAIVWMLLVGDLRRSLLGALGALLHPKILISSGFALFYVTLIILALQSVGYWQPILLKDTILWSILSGSVLFARSFETKGGVNLFRNLLVDNLKVVLIIEFLVNTYTFNLLAELILLPLIAALAMFGALAQSDEQFAKLAKATSAVLMLIGLGLILQALWRALGDMQTLASTLTLRELALPFLLSVSLAPLIYLIRVYAHYDRILLRLSLSESLQCDRTLRWYAVRKIFQKCGLSFRKLGCLCGPREVRLMQIRSKEDVDSLLRFDADKGAS